MKTILLTTPWPRYSEVAKLGGFKNISVWDIRDRETPAFNKSKVFSDEVYLVDFSQPDRLKNLVSWLMNHSEIDYMYHVGKDSDLELAYSLASLHDKNKNPLDTILKVNSKSKMRDHFKEHNLSTIAYQSFDTLKDLMDLKTLPYPFIVKPTSLSGSKGVQLCTDENELMKWSVDMKFYDYDGGYIIEEYLEGTEVSVETLSLKGEHLLVGITDKFKTKPPLFVETGHQFPSQLPQEIQGLVQELVFEALDSLNFEFGPMHTEVIITSHGPKIVELQPRLAGDRIPRLVEISTGTVLEQEVLHMLEGRKAQIGIKEKIAHIHYFEWAPGNLKSISGIDDIKKLDFVHDFNLNLSDGDEIPIIKDSSSRYGYVIFEASSSTDVNLKIELIESLITLDYQT